MQNPYAIERFITDHNADARPIAELQALRRKAIAGYSRRALWEGWRARLGQWVRVILAASARRGSQLGAKANILPMLLPKQKGNDAIRVMMLILLLPALAAPVSAGHLAGGDDGQIIPGKRIGLARLGMSEDEVEAINGETNCPVEAFFDLSGSAVRLVTEWGGSCRVSGEVQVGVSFVPALDAFGRPDEVIEDAKYAGATAFWVSYRAWGIAFRVLLIRESSAMIQAIAVFRGTALAAARPQPLPSEPWKSPEPASDPRPPHVIGPMTTLEAPFCWGGGRCGL